MKGLEARITRIVDGDTVIGQIRIRLQDVQAAEAGTPVGKTATARLRARYQGKRVILHVITTDAWNRLLARITNVLPKSGS